MRAFQIWLKMDKRVTFQRSHRFHSTNSGTNSDLNLSNSTSPLCAASLTRTKSAVILTLASSISNPVSFFTDSLNFDNNRSEPRRIARVKLGHEKPSDSFEFPEEEARNIGCLRGKCFLCCEGGGSGLKITRFGDLRLSNVGAERSRVGL